MKKRIAALLAALMLVFAAAAMAAPAAWYTDIYVSSAPYKTAYTVGEAFDPAGLSIVGNLQKADGTTAKYQLGLGSLRVSPAKFTSAGTASVTLTLSCVAASGEMEDFSTTLPVSVQAPAGPDVWATGIRVYGMPEKADYSAGEAFDPDGIYVVATLRFKDGGSTTGDVTPECYYSHGRLNSSGDTTVTVFCDLPDKDGHISTFADSITVNVAPNGTAPLFSSGSALPNGTVGEPYSYYIKASGTKSIEIAQYYNPGRSNEMPDGMRFSSSGSGHLKGTPKAAGEYSFWAYAANDFGEDYKEFTVSILPAPTPAPSATPAASTPAPSTKPALAEAVAAPSAKPASAEAVAAPTEAAAAPAETPAHAHAATGAWQSDESSHWHACGGCDEKLDLGAHDILWSAAEPAQGSSGKLTGVCKACGRAFVSEVQYTDSDEAPQRGGVMEFLPLALGGVAAVIIIAIVISKLKKRR